MVAQAINASIKQHVKSGNAVPKVFVARLITNIAAEFNNDNGNFNRTVFTRACMKDLDGWVDPYNEEDLRARF